MIGKDQESFVIGRYPYAEVEPALATALELDPTALPALRARLKRFARLGLPESAPGTGARRKYSPEEVGLILVVLLLHTLGQTPTAAIAAVKRPGTRKLLAMLLRWAADGEARKGNHVFLTARIEDYAKTGPGLSPIVWIGGFRRRSKGPGNPETVTDFLDRMADGPEAGLWLAIFNLTVPMLRLAGALPFR
jgi:hypothetical protein